MTIITVNGNVYKSVIGKASEDIKRELLKIPKVEQIKKACMDMCAPFAKAVRDVIPGAEIILDRFHIIKLINEKLWDQNKKYYKKLDEEERKRFSNIRYILSKSYTKLEHHEKRLLKDYLRINPEIKAIYWKIQDFRKILFGSKGKKPNEVSQQLMLWTEGTRKLLGGFVKTLETWWSEVVNACIYAESNAKQEGLNNKIKLIKRKAFGFRNWLNFESHIIAGCNT